MNPLSFALAASVLSLSVAQGTPAWSMIPVVENHLDGDVIKQVLIANRNKDRFIQAINREILALSRDGTIVDEQAAQEFDAISSAALRGQQIGWVLSFDIDGNGTVTKAEVEGTARKLYGSISGNERPSVATRVMALDKNNDGEINAAEMSALERKSGSRQALRIRSWLALDPNKDGKLTVSEAMELAGARWKAVDTDGNGTLSPSEFSALTGIPEAATAPPRHLEHPGPFPTSLPSSSPVRGGDEEVHLVGIYEGYMKSAEGVHGPRVSVTVNRPGKKVTLLVCSYAPARWLISVAPETEIKQIVAFGHSALASQSSEFLLNGKPVKAESFPRQHSNCPYKPEGHGFRDFVKNLERETGFKRIDSFRGSYNAKPDGYMIDTIEERPEFMPTYLKAVDPSELPLIRFHASLGEGPGLYDLAGRLVESSGRHEVGNIVDVPTRKERYSLSENGLRKFTDGGSRTGSVIPASLDVPRMSWPSGIAYDSKRDRIVVVSHGGEGYLYEYKLPTGAWRVVSSMNHMDVRGLVYDPKSDLLYGIEGVFGASRIVAINPEGGAAKSITFDPKKFAGSTDLYDPGNSHLHAELAAIDGDNAVIVAGSPSRYRIYLLNMKSGDVKLTGFRD